DAMHLVALVEQKLRKVRAVLSGDAGDEGRRGHQARECRPALGREARTTACAFFALRFDLAGAKLVQSRIRRFLVPPPQMKLTSLKIVIGSVLSLALVGAQPRVLHASAPLHDVTHRLVMQQVGNEVARGKSAATTSGVAKFGARQASLNATPNASG